MSFETLLAINDDDNAGWRTQMPCLPHQETVCATERLALRKEIQGLRADLIRLACGLAAAEQLIQAQKIAMLEAQKNCKRRGSLTNILQELKPILGEIPTPITTTTVNDTRHRASPGRPQSLPWAPRHYTTYQTTGMTGTRPVKLWHTTSPANYTHLAPRMQTVGIGNLPPQMGPA